MIQLIITHIQNSDLTWDSFIPHTNVKVKRAVNLSMAKAYSRILLDEELKNDYFIKAESSYFYRNESCKECGLKHD